MSSSAPVFGQAFDDVLVVAPVGPGVLADGYPKPHATEAHRTGHGPGGEHPLFVEHAVIRQVDLEADGVDAPAGKERISIVELAVLDPRRPDEERGTAVAGFACQRLDCGTASGLERRLEHQVLRRIAGDEELGKSDEIGAVVCGLRTRLAGALQIAGNVADDGIELRHRYRQPIGGARVHAQSAATAGSGFALPSRSDFKRSANRNARSSDCSALSLGSQTV